MRADTSGDNGVVTYAMYNMGLVIGCSGGDETHTHLRVYLP